MRGYFLPLRWSFFSSCLRNSFFSRTGHRLQRGFELQHFFFGLSGFLDTPCVG